MIKEIMIWIGVGVKWFAIAWVVLLIVAGIVAFVAGVWFVAGWLGMLGLGISLFLLVCLCMAGDAGR